MNRTSVFSKYHHFDPTHFLQSNKLRGYREKRFSLHCREFASFRRYEVQHDTFPDFLTPRHREPWLVPSYKISHAAFLEVYNETKLP
jgi:hypothetical protein